MLQTTAVANLNPILTKLPCNIELCPDERCPDSHQGLVVGLLFDLKVLSSLHCVDQHELVYRCNQNYVSSLISNFGCWLRVGKVGYKIST